MKVKETFANNYKIHNLFLVYVLMSSKQGTGLTNNPSLFSRSDGNARESIKTHFEIIAFKDSDVKLSSFSILRLNKTYTDLNEQVLNMLGI